MPRGGTAQSLQSHRYQIGRDELPDRGATSVLKEVVSGLPSPFLPFIVRSPSSVIRRSYRMRAAMRGSMEAALE